MKMTNESGRSMVEMLGVLAIIGVLSIGGIAGYTLAMNRYRANEIMNLASQVAIIAASKNGGAGDDASLSDLPGATKPAGLSDISATKYGVTTVTLDGDYAANLATLIEQLGGDKATCSNGTCTLKLGAS